MEPLEIFLLVFLLVVLLGGIGAYVFFINDKNDKKG